MLKGSKMSAESREKISAALLGEKNPNYGKHFGPESKAKMSLAKKGKKLSPQHRANLSESQLRLHRHLSLENKAKLVAANTGRRITEETRQKMSAAKTPEIRAKLSAAKKGQHMSLETKAKLSASKMGKGGMFGENNPMYGKRPSEETRIKMSAAQKGRHHSEETKAKISAIHKGKYVSEETRKRLSNAFSGEKSSKWQGGISFEPYCPKFNRDLKRRVREYFDNRCVICGKEAKDNSRRNGNVILLSVHHVEYDKLACCHGKPVQFAALCHSCHSKTNNDRAKWEAMLHKIIEEIWNGRSYLTKDEWENRQVDKGVEQIPTELRCQAQPSSA